MREPEAIVREPVVREHPKYRILKRTTVNVLDDDGEQTEVSTYTETVPMDPDGDDLEYGLTDHVAKAIDYLTHEYPVEASIYPHGHVHKGTWLAAEPYQHPYSGDVEETTYHFEGPWTDREVQTVVEAVLGE